MGKREPTPIDWDEQEDIERALSRRLKIEGVELGDIPNYSDTALAMAMAAIDPIRRKIYRKHFSELVN